MNILTPEEYRRKFAFKRAVISHYNILFNRIFIVEHDYFNKKYFWKRLYEKIQDYRYEMELIRLNDDYLQNYTN